MRVLIVEDEQMARASLVRNLSTHFDDVEIVGAVSSVKETLDWLNDPMHTADTIFMDVELGDGDCFSILSQHSVSANVVMTTAYDSYAIKAFEAGSIDYLLKPIDGAALERAVSRCRSRLGSQTAAYPHDTLQPAAYRERFTVHVGDSIIPIIISDIAMFFSDHKSNYLMTKDGVCYIVDSSMETIEKILNPQLFFRTSRGCIVSRSIIGSVRRHIGGRLRIFAEPEPPMDITVARARVDDFLKWFDQPFCMSR